jgi:hypothetical protein
MHRNNLKSIFTLCAVLAFGLPSLHAQSNGCKAGYVPREAVSGDNVCVTPAEHEQALTDNRTENKRHQRDSDRCIPGYVWREAQSGDHVCVTHEVREQTKQENEQTASHAGNSGPQPLVIQKGRESQTQIPQKVSEVQLLKGFHRVTDAEMLKMRQKFPQSHAREVEREFRPAVPAATMISTASAAGMAIKSLTPAPPAQIQGYEVAFNLMIEHDQNSTEWKSVGHAPMQQLHMGLEEYGAAIILLTLNANPGQNYMLDCDLGAGGIYTDIDYFSTNVTPHQYYEWLFYNNGNLGGLDGVGGTVSLTSEHTLIPIPAGPANTVSIGIKLTDPNDTVGISPSFTGQSWIGINGCTLGVVNLQ